MQGDRVGSVVKGRGEARERIRIDVTDAVMMFVDRGLGKKDGVQDGVEIYQPLLTLVARGKDPLTKRNKKFTGRARK
jgi:hypothetical protein